MGRRVVGGVVIVAVLVVAAVLGYGRLVRVPRPDLPLPAGQELVSVRSNCASGGELTGCSTPGPRSLLTVEADSPREGADALFAALEADGWGRDEQGLTAHDAETGGQPELLQPVWCKDGCVALFRLTAEGYVLAWFDS